MKTPWMMVGPQPDRGKWSTNTAVSFISKLAVGNDQKCSVTQDFSIVILQEHQKDIPSSGRNVGATFKSVHKLI